MEKYRIDGRLGSVGNIFRCTRVADGAPFALKRIPLAHLDREAEQRARFEMGLAQRLHHPSIVRCFDAFEFAGNNVCLVLTHYTRGDLHAFLQSRVGARQGFLEEEHVMRWFVDVLLALHYLHSHGIVHRDVKASNVFLDGAAQSDAPAGVVLGDFGIAHVVDAEAHEATVSGTPQYMAPELLQSGNVHSFQSDVWALGCVLYEMLCFRHPFDAKDVSSLVVKVIRGNFPPLPQRYSRDVCELVVRLLDVDPSTRPTVEEVLAMPMVAQHLRRHFAAHTARGALSTVPDSDRRNYLVQMASLGVVPAQGTVTGREARAPAQPGGHSRRTSSLSPSRLSHQPSPTKSDSSPRGPLHGRRAQQPRGSVAGSHAVSSVAYNAHGGRHERLDAPVDHLSATGTSQFSSAPSAQESALYEAAREHDAAYTRLKDAHRRGMYGAATTSVRDTVDRVVYGPPARQAERRSPYRESSDSVGGLLGRPPAPAM